MQNAQQTYNVTFIWKERIYKDSDTQLRCGSMRFEFNVDVRDFVEGNIENLILLLFSIYLVAFFLSIQSLFYKLIILNFNLEYPEKLVKKFDNATKSIPAILC